MAQDWDVRESCDHKHLDPIYLPGRAAHGEHAQLILSFCYFALNSFLTRIQVEEEWNSYSRSYKPLRVSHPRGQQISHYRLQLPYKYSIPLIGMSILLHWILSNAIFLTIIEGGK